LRAKRRNNLKKGIFARDAERKIVKARNLVKRKFGKKVPWKSKINQATTKLKKQKTGVSQG